MAETIDIYSLLDVPRAGQSPATFFHLAQNPLSKNWSAFEALYIIYRLKNFFSANGTPIGIKFFD